MNTNCHQFLSRSSQSYLRQNTKWHVLRFCKQKLHYDLSIGGKYHFSTITSSKVNGIRKLLSCRNDLFIAEKCLSAKYYQFVFYNNEHVALKLVSCKELSQDKGWKPLNILLSIFTGPTLLKKEATIRNTNSKPNQARQQWDCSL